MLVGLNSSYLITELTRKVMKNMSVQFEISKWNPGIFVFCQFLEKNLSNPQSSGGAYDSDSLHCLGKFYHVQLNSTANSAHLAHFHRE